MERAVDERERQPDGDAGHAEPAAWRANGAQRGTPGGRGDEPWSSAGAALEPSAEPLALLASGRTGEPGQAGGEARHRRPPAPGLDDDTPVSGLPVAEPPLWREAARHSPQPGTAPGADPGPAYQYPSTPVADLLRRRSEDDPPAAGAPAAEGEPAAARPAAETRGLPQRVPAEPDVPVSGEPDPGAPAPAEAAAARERWTAPELAWIADQLRRDDVPGDAPSEPLDVEAVVAAVREVAGVQAAEVRTSPTGVHTLRLDLADDADPGQVSRAVARLLLERMGLSAAPQHVPQARTPKQDNGPPVATAPTDPPDPVASVGSVEPAGPVATEVPDPGGPPLAPPLTPPPAPPLTPPPAPDEVDAWRYRGFGGDQEVGGDQGFGGDQEFGAAPIAEEPPPVPVSRPLIAAQPGPRVVIDQVQVRTLGLEATVEVQLTAGEQRVTGVAGGPAVDSYLVRLAAIAAAKAIDSLLRGVNEPGGPSRCFVEHTGVVAFGTTEVAVVVLLLVCGGWVEQLTGSALVDGDPRQAVVRATLGAVNRRLEALLD